MKCNRVFVCAFRWLATLRVGRWYVSVVVGTKPSVANLLELEVVNDGK